jgi:trigger factor
VEGKAVEGLEAADFVFEVGGGRIFEEVEEAVVGMNAGETKTVAFTLPEGFPDELANKTADFTVTVKEIKEKVLPPYTDKWASEISEFPTLLELRAEIRGKLQAGKTYQANQKFRALAVKAVADNATLDLPDIVVTEQAEEMFADFVRSVQGQGADIDAYLAATGMTAQQMVEDMKPSAASNVKTGLVLDAVAKAEGLEASDEEIRATVTQMAMAGRTDPKLFEERIRKSGRLQAIGWQVVRDKAADFIAANAVAVKPLAVEEAKEAPAKAEAEKPAKPKTTRSKAAKAAAEAAPVEPAPAEAAPAEATSVEAATAEAGAELAAEAAPEAAAEPEAPEA